MNTKNMVVGHYGVDIPTAYPDYEDETWGNSMVATHGIIVSRIEGESVFIREWEVDAQFKGDHVLEKFQEAREEQAFLFDFSAEREISEADDLNGYDPQLKKHLLEAMKNQH